MLNVAILPHNHSFASNTYLVDDGNECVVIDPAAPFPASGLSKKLKYIILTHAHFDHMLDIDEWVSKSGAEVLVGAPDFMGLSDSELNCYMLLTGQDRGYSGEATKVYDGDVFQFGKTEIKVLSTPGHTPGSLSLLIDDMLFVGDTIFAGGGYGKCCFPGGSFSDIRKSIDKLVELDGNITVFPGHGEQTTIKEYKKDIFR
ncbi:MAG: MBL fold metallo-hydrolase [Clostridia bacterium]|nr:MBL fold metallo-hydrolase [Clostridia bacterium]